MVCAAWLLRQPAFVNGSFRILRCSALGVRYASVGWQVSSHGRVSTTAGRIHYGSPDCSGYRSVVIGSQRYKVHRLVAAAFLDPPPTPTCWQVNHVDGDSENNRVTKSAVRHALRESKAFMGNQPSAGRRMLPSWARPSFGAPCGEEAWSFCASQREAARLLGVCQGSISNCIRGLARKSCGDGVWYEFKAAPLDEQCPLPDEIWRPARYPGQPAIIPNLLVSNYGRVWQAKSGFGLVSYGTRLRSGYYTVRRGGRHMLVHRVVAATFLGQPGAADIQVNHKDLNPGNNRLENLEYATAAQNSRHFWQMRSGDARNSGGKAVQAYSIADSSGGPWLDFDSIAAAVRHTGIYSTKIVRICEGLGTSASWDFRFAAEEQIPGEEWRSVVLEGARRPSL